MPEADTFILRSTLTSPFGRKVRIAIDVLGLTGRVAVVLADTLDENDSPRRHNPLGKMPCLLLPDGTSIYDSKVIIEFLAETAGNATLIPPRGLARYLALTRATLADGITEAALLMVYEGRFRDDDKHSARWLAHQRGKVMRGLATFEAAPPPANATDIVSIGLVCALGYLDWRKPVDWRAPFPGLVRWLEDFSTHEPAVARTARPATS